MTSLPHSMSATDVAQAFNEGDEKYRVEVLGQMQGLVARGVIDGHEYARGKHFFYRRSLDSKRWELFCGADCDLTLEVAKSIHAEGRLLSEVKLPDGYVRPMSCAAEAPSDLALLRDYRANEARVLDEAAAAIEADGDIPDETSIAALAEMIQKHPLRAALRWLNLEAQVRIQRHHLETIEQRLGGVR